MSQTATDTAIVTIEGEYETAVKLLNGTGFNDLEWSLSQISRWRHYSKSKNSKMVQDRAIFTMADQYKVALWSIERCHFQWPWTTRNLVFKVTPFFDTEYLTNGYRYGYSYYRRRIGNRTQAFEWHQFQWHWVTSNPDFKVTILFNVKKLENGTT